MPTTTRSLHGPSLTNRATSQPPRMTRRVGAVLGGLLTIFALSTGTDVLMHASHVFPPFGERMADPLFLLATAYRAIYGVVGCYVTARLAPDRPLHHALALGGMGLALSVAGALVMGDQGPAWYSLAVIAMSLPCAWVGARLRMAQLSR